MKPTSELQLCNEFELVTNTILLGAVSVKAIHDSCKKEIEKLFKMHECIESFIAKNDSVFKEESFDYKYIDTVLVRAADVLRFHIIIENRKKDLHLNYACNADYKKMIDIIYESMAILNLDPICYTKKTIAAFGPLLKEMEDDKCIMTIKYLYENKKIYTEYVNMVRTLFSHYDGAKIPFGLSIKPIEFESVDYLIDDVLEKRGKAAFYIAIVKTIVMLKDFVKVLEKINIKDRIDTYVIYEWNKRDLN